MATHYGKNPNLGFWRVTSPTEKQLELMRDICKTLGVREPILTRGSVSDFISENIVRYKEVKNANCGL